MNTLVAASRLLALTFTTVFLSSCATPAQITERFEREWKGKHIDQAIVEYGVPDKVADLSSGKIYQWTKYSNGGSASASTYGNTTLVNSTTRSCTLKLQTDEKKIIQAIHWNGDFC